MADTGPPGRRALIIATGRHDNPGIPDLMGPVFDAAAMSSTLRKLGGFTVDLLLIDRPAEELLDKIEAFLFSFDEQETALVYFSGHGFKLEERGAGAKPDNSLWLAASDTDPKKPVGTALRAAEIRALLERSKARAKIWILDCCNAAAAVTGEAGGGTKGWHGFFDSVTRDFPRTEGDGAARPNPMLDLTRADKGLVAARPPEQGRGLYFLFAAGDGQPARDGDTGSPYTAMLIKGMTSIGADRDGDGWISVWELARYVDSQHRTMFPAHEVVRMMPSSDVRGAADGDVWIICGRPRRFARWQPLRAALGDPVGPFSGVAAALALGAVHWTQDDSVPAALTVAMPIGLSGYLVYLAVGTILRFRRPAAGTAD
ncbi:hypothetical protein DMB66_29255 [Actinoplanes sp. ATCC 53533]|uniref:caspase family protein n=1 Tax=Actinoplanes sp. ATCC 53533 TaxID=1288362 RepID=UPI000F78BA09|nr:caspase family protein [Actinoplanes sp. ATCC 53533]RSM58364.1 hypothetical protein DMB66_29255 [Actinoplanes sp. ATCC 53533]